MLAVTGPLPTGAEWSYELKWDGVRALAVAGDGILWLSARSGADITVAYPELAPLGQRPGRVVLDGEIVVLDPDGRPSFAALAERMHVRDAGRAAQLAATVPVTYMIFDLLERDGEDLTGLPYTGRRAELEQLGLAGSRWVVPPSFTDGDATLAAAAEHSLEGVVAKRRDSRYRPAARSSDWVKVKFEQTDDFVVGGWRPGQRRLGALLVGTPDGRGGLVFRGRVGGGIGHVAERELLAALTPLHTDTSPFTGPLDREDAREARWVQPRLVVEVRYGQRTPDGRLRFPRFVRQRPDKTPADCVEVDAAVASPPAPADPVAADDPVPVDDSLTVRVAGRNLELSNLTKVLYPRTGFTKAEVIDYYTRVAPAALPHLQGRPLTRVRFPNGVDAPSFFEKNVPAGVPAWVRRETLPVPGSAAGRQTLDFVVADDLATLVWLANLAALELHTPQWRIGAAGPDLLVMDLDPGAPAGLPECCEVALVLRDRLAADGLVAWPKTSGRKGLQLYCPISSTQPARVVSSYAKRVAAELRQADPGRITDQMAKRLRPGKVFIDWSQNNAAKTTVAPYSLRAEPAPRVSTPLTWDEVAAGQARGFEPGEVLDRVQRYGDLLAGLLETGPELPTS